MFGFIFYCHIPAADASWHSYSGLLGLLLDKRRFSLHLYIHSGVLATKLPTDRFPGRENHGLIFFFPFPSFLCTTALCKKCVKDDAYGAHGLESVTEKGGGMGGWVSQDYHV